MYKKNAEVSCWQRVLFLSVGIGLAAGLAASFFPKFVFYETEMYYSWCGNIEMAEPVGVQSILLSMLQENLRGTLLFFGIRVLLPGVVLSLCSLKRKTIGLHIYAIVLLASVSFQSVLIFGGSGMEGWFRYQLRNLASESIFLLALVRAYELQKREILKRTMILCCILQIYFILLCGSVLEVLTGYGNIYGK